MSAAPDSTRRLDVTTFVRVWAESLAQVLEQITSTELSCVILTEAPSELPPAAETDQWIVCTCSGALRGEMSLRLSPAVVLGFAQVFMGEPAAPEVPLTAEHREAVLELFRQVAGVAATSLEPNWGEVQLRIETTTGAASWPSASTFWLRAGKEKAADALVELNLSAALNAAVAAAVEAARQADVRTTSAAVPMTATAPPPLSPLTAAQNETKLDLLMDVELAMTLRFGARRLLLREILDLCPGAVVELDRQVKDPVELMLDGRLVARGEVVVIDGNYGLRVTEVISARGN